MSEILHRDSAGTLDVDTRRRLIELIAVPWEQKARVFIRGEEWFEVFTRSAFNGIEDHAGRIRVNREHTKGDTVGKIQSFDSRHPDGLLATVKVANTPRGDETLALAEEDMIGASIGYRLRSPADVQLNKQTRVRRVNRAVLDHLSLVESPAFAEAQVLAVRSSTPHLDAALDSPVLEWAAARCRRREALLGMAER